MVMTRVAALVMAAATLGTGCAGIGHGGTSASQGITLRVTDKNGSVTQVSHVSSGPGAGNLFLGDSVMNFQIPWSKISKVSIPEGAVVGNMSPYPQEQRNTAEQHMATVTLQNGKTLHYWLRDMTISGETDIGRCSFNLSSMREIVNVSEQDKH